MSDTSSSRPPQAFWRALNVGRGHLDVRQQRVLVASVACLKALFDRRDGAIASDFTDAWTAFAHTITTTDLLFRRLADAGLPHLAYLHLAETFRRVSHERSAGRTLDVYLEAIGEIAFPTPPLASALDFAALVDSFFRGRAEESPTTPSAVTDLLIRLSYEPNATSYADPFAGIGNTLLRLADLVENDAHLHGGESNKETWTLAAMACLLARPRRIEVTYGDTLRQPPRDDRGAIARYDVIVADPPIGIKKWGYDSVDVERDERFGSFGTALKNKGDLATIQHCLSAATHRAVVTTATSVLWRTTTVDKHVRSRWIEDDLLESVILLPAGLRRDTQVRLAILAFAKTPNAKPRGQVLFIDASEADTQDRRKPELRTADVERISGLVTAFRQGRLSTGVVQERFATVATAGEIAEKEYSLSLPLYVNLVVEVEMPITETLQADLVYLRQRLRESESSFDSVLQTLNAVNNN